MASTALRRLAAPKDLAGRLTPLLYLLVGGSPQLRWRCYLKLDCPYIIIYFVLHRTDASS